MSQVTFRGKTYNSEFEMPEDVRRAYQESQTRKTNQKSLSDLVDMPDEVKAVYERALNRVEKKYGSATEKDLPKTEDIYRQSAPENMRHLPSDESVYQASQPLIDSTNSTIEPEPSLVPGRLVSSIVWALVLAAIVVLILQFLT